MADGPRLASGVAFLGALLLVLPVRASEDAAGAEAPPRPATQLRDVVFDRYTPLSASREVVRRVLTPITFRFAERKLAESRLELKDQPVDLAQERFSVYLPAGTPPPGGYGLLVFVAPWAAATEPNRWRSALDRHGLILVSMANAGNEASLLERRLPLALLAWANVTARWPVDAERVYVGGMSGGSRVAEVTALAYPDVFRGALLNAGSDPVGGEKGIYLPPADLMKRFQASRLVLVTGSEDELNLQDDRLARASLEAACAFRLVVQQAPRLGHEPVDARALEAALAALDRPPALEPERVARCNARIERELEGRLAEVEAALKGGDKAGARARLKAVDARYGGLAAPASLVLDERISAAE